MAGKRERKVKRLAALLAVSMVIPQSVPTVHAFAEEYHGKERWVGKAIPSKASPPETYETEEDGSGILADVDRRFRNLRSGNQAEYDLDLVVSEVKDKEWDGTDAVSCKIGLTGVRAGWEKVSLKSYTLRFEDPEVGKGKKVIVENVVLDGGDAFHYRLAQERYTFDSNGEITRRKLYVSGTAADRAYKKGDTKADINVRIENVAMVDYDSSKSTLIPENLGVSVRGHFEDEHVGEEKKVIIDDIALSGIHGENYEVVEQFGALTGTVWRAGRDAPDLTYSNSVITGTDSTMEWRLQGGEWQDCGASIPLTEIGTYEVRYKETSDYLASELFTLTLGNRIQRIEDVTFSFEDGYIPEKEYDRTVQAPSRITWSGPAQGDQVELVSYTAAYEQGDVGERIPVSITAPVFSGRDAEKYEEYFSKKTLATTYGTITPRTIHVHVAAMDKDYDGTRSARVYVCGHTSFVGEERPDFAVTGTFEDEQAGEGKAVTYGQVSLSGPDSGNYRIGKVTPAKIEDGALKELSSLSAAIRKAPQKAPDKTLFSIKSGKLLGFTSDMEVLLPGNREYTDCDGLMDITVSQGSSYLFRYKESANYKAGAATKVSVGVEKTITITFDLNGTAVDGDYPVTATRTTGQFYGDILVDLTLADPDLEFAGWFTEREGGVQVTAGDLCDRTEDFTLYAHVREKKEDRRDGEISVSVSDVMYGNLVGPQAASKRGDYEKYAYFYKKAEEDDSAYTLEKPYRPGDYVVKAVAAGTDSYKEAEAKADFQITKRILTAAFTPKSRPYNGLTFCVVEGEVSLEGSVMVWNWGKDDVEISGTPSVNFVDKQVGKGKEVRLSGLSLTGSDAECYELRLGTGTADITPYVLNYKEGKLGQEDRNAFSLTAGDKIYDDTVDVTITSALTKMDGDDMAIRGGGRFKDSNAGEGKEVAVTSLILEGADGANYELSYPDSLTLKADIHKAVNGNYPDISGTNPVMGRKNGTITGLTSAMEYSVDGGISWIGCPDGELTGLGPGEYRVRFSETENYLASGVKIMTLRDSQSGDKIFSVSFDLNGGSSLTGIPSPIQMRPGSSYPVLPNILSADSSRPFLGWFTKEGVRIQTGDRYQGETVLYAKFGVAPEGKIEVSARPYAYGERPSVQARILSGSYIAADIRYRYRLKSGEEWQEGLPNLPGEYRVQAVIPGSDTVPGTSAECDVTVRRREVSLEIQSRDKVYDGTKKAEAKLNVSGILEGDEVSVLAETVYDSHMPGSRVLQVTSVKLTGADQRKYTLSSDTYTFPGVIHKKTGESVAVKGIKESVYGKHDGVIEGVTKDMEYRKAGDQAWTPCPSGSIAGLSGGTYEIRMRETEITTAGPVQTVKILSEKTLEMTVIQPDGSKKTVEISYGQKLERPADPVKSGYSFGGWYKDSTLTQKWDFDHDVMTDHVTLYPKWVRRLSGGSSRSSGGSSGSRISQTTVSQAKAVTGRWEKDLAGHWRFYGSHGYENEWAYIANPYADKSKGQEDASWFHFGNDGIMDIGWFTDTDGKLYYLNPVSDNTLGRMLTGWHWLRGQDGLRRCYYFEEKSNGFRGMLYRSANTPDGYTVGADGAWTVQGVAVTRE
ncbi:YDG domain-containing protein [Candidatus Ventrimonas sp. KK005]